jgi:hypothetical protein
MADRDDGKMDAGLDDLMSQMGVKKLSGQTRRRPKRESPTAPKTTAPKATAPKTTADDKNAPGKSVPAPPETGPDEDERARLAQAEMEARARLQEENQRLRDERDAAEAARQLDGERLKQLEVERNALEGTIRQMGGEQAVQQATLVGRLGSLGFQGELAQAQLLRGVADARLGREFLSHLLPASVEGLERFLTDRVVRVCGSETCQPPAGRVAVHVSTDRCDLCAGMDVDRAIRNFVDGCLINGWRKVSVVGGRVTAHLLLRKWVRHRRLELDCMALSHGGQLSALLAAHRPCDLLVVWDPAGEVDGQIVGEFDVQHVVRVGVDGLAPMLQDAGRQIKERA